MKQFLEFWKKDFINKLIIIHTTLLFIGVTALVVLIFRMPEGKTFGGMLGNLFPTPTTEPKVLMTQAAEKAILKMYFATASVQPTITTAPLVELFATETPTPEGYVALPTDTPPPSATPYILPTATVLVAQVQPTNPPAAAPTLSASLPASVLSLECLPKNEPEKGRVLDVLEGNLIKVLIGDYAYIVKYIGVEAPADSAFALLSTNTNGSMIFGKDVLLYKDTTDTDNEGRFLRYVVMDGQMPALTLLEKGLLTSYDPAPNNACFALMKNSEQKARDGRQGVWTIK